MPHGLEIHADHRRQFLQPGADYGSILNIRAEFQPVLDVVWHKPLASGRMHDLGDAPQNNQVSIFLQIPGITCMQPPALKGFGGRFGFVEVPFEYAVRAYQDLPVLGDGHLDAGRGFANRMKAHFTRRLNCIDRAVFGLTVELAQLDPQGSVENKSVFADRFPAGERVLETAHPELVLDRAENHHLAQKPAQWLKYTAAFAVQLARFRRDGPIHEKMVQPFLQRGRIFDTNLDCRQHLVPASWRRQIEGRSDLAHVAHNRFLTFRHVHGEPPKQRRGNGYGVVSHPGHRQVREDLLIFVEGTRRMSIPSSSKNVLLTQYDALRCARRSGGVQKNGRIFRLRTTKQFLTQARGFVQIVLTNFDQVIPGHQPFNLVEAKTARFIINDVVDALGARVLQFQDLVNLFLIFRNSRDDLDFAKKVP